MVDWVRLAAARSSSSSDVVLLFAVVVGLLALGGVVAIAVRRWWRSVGESVASVPFSMSQLRAMHREGQLTDEQFTRLRDQLVARMRAGVGADGAEGGGPETRSTGDRRPDAPGQAGGEAPAER